MTMFNDIYNTSCSSTHNSYINNEIQLFILCCVAFIGILIIIYIRRSRFDIQQRQYGYEHMSESEDRIPDHETCFVHPSQIQNAGYGLWAKKDIKKGDLVIEYEGIYHNSDNYDYESECDGKNCFIYLFCDEKNCWDSKDNKDFIARYSNDCYNSDFECNAQFEMVEGKPYIVASTDIKKGDEIFTTYGNSYWTNK